MTDDQKRAIEHAQKVLRAVKPQADLAASFPRASDAPIGEAGGEWGEQYMERHWLLLTKLQIGGCTCLTRTPKLEFHEEDCQYRIVAEIKHMLAEIPSDFPLVAQPQAAPKPPADDAIESQRSGDGS